MQSIAIKYYRSLNSIAYNRKNVKKKFMEDFLMKLENGVEDIHVYPLDLEMSQSEMDDGFLYFKYIEPLSNWIDALYEAQALALKTELPVDVDTNPCASSLKYAELYLALNPVACGQDAVSANIMVVTNNGTEATTTLRVDADEQELSDIMLCFGV